MICCGYYDERLQYVGTTDLVGEVSQEPRYEVVFFDLYGTLIDIRTDEQSDAAWRSLYETVRELGSEYESVGALRERFKQLGGGEMMHWAERDVSRDGDQVKQKTSTW